MAQANGIVQDGLLHSSHPKSLLSITRCGTRQALSTEYSQFCRVTGFEVRNKWLKHLAPLEQWLLFCPQGPLSTENTKSKYSRRCAVFGTGELSTLFQHRVDFPQCSLPSCSDETQLDVGSLMQHQNQKIAFVFVNIIISKHVIEFGSAATTCSV
jgi:hypothetical protein